MTSFAKFLATIALSVACLAAHAVPITPTYDSFAQLAGATFGGSGIPNDPTAISSGAVGPMGNQVTLGLIATQRYSNPALTNDGAGTYTAMAGANTGNPGPGGTLPGALWNLGFYADVTPGTPLDALTLLLRYDFDPAAGTDRAAHGEINIGAAFAATTMATAYPPIPIQGSENLLFAFLGVAVPGILTPPTFSPFDPNAAGEYTFELEAIYNPAGTAPVSVARSAIRVNVVGVPEPGTLALAVGGIALLGRSRRRA